MKELQKPEKYYLLQAVHFVDTLYEKGYFSPDVSRKDMRGVDELLAFLFESQVNSAIKVDQMLRRFEEKRKDN